MVQLLQDDYVRALIKDYAQNLPNPLRPLNESLFILTFFLFFRVAHQCEIRFSFCVCLGELFHEFCIEFGAFFFSAFCLCIFYEFECICHSLPKLFVVLPRSQEAVEGEAIGQHVELHDLELEGLPPTLAPRLPCRPDGADGHAHAPPDAKHRAADTPGELGRLGGAFPGGELRVAAAGPVGGAGGERRRCACLRRRERQEGNGPRGRHHGKKCKRVPRLKHTLRHNSSG
mmetsp:Transcript_111010/g.314166  ORF Transcript_111010/g.314166 Transcript_111010/m.314166 type:complete len:230 (+) Transcript_111010:1184-1873(+)